MNKYLVFLMASLVAFATSAAKMTKEEKLLINYPQVVKIFGTYIGQAMVPDQGVANIETCKVSIYPIARLGKRDLEYVLAGVSYEDQLNKVKNIIRDGGIYLGSFLSDKTNFLKASNDGGVAIFKKSNSPLFGWLGEDLQITTFNFSDNGDLFEIYVKDKNSSLSEKIDFNNENVGCTRLSKIED